MASGATIYKVELQIADMDRGYYHDHSLTIARHPSETDERLMVRVLAFALHAHEALTFGRGLSAQDEPDLWRKDLTGFVEQWIEIGQPDERDVRRACNRAKQVIVVCYGGRGVDLWWSQNQEKLGPLENLTVVNLPIVATRSLAQLTSRSMRLQCNIQEGQMSVVNDSDIVQVELATLLTAKHGDRN